MRRTTVLRFNLEKQPATASWSRFNPLWTEPDLEI
jgi:hypothetical protein